MVTCLNNVCIAHYRVSLTQPQQYYLDLNISVNIKQKQTVSGKVDKRVCMVGTAMALMAYKNNNNGNIIIITMQNL